MYTVWHNTINKRRHFCADKDSRNLAFLLLSTPLRTHKDCDVQEVMPTFSSHSFEDYTVKSWVGTSFPHNMPDFV